MVHRFLINNEKEQTEEIARMLGLKALPFDIVVLTDVRPICEEVELC